MSVWRSLTFRIDTNERLGRVAEAIRLVGWPKLVLLFFFKELKAF